MDLETIIWKFVEKITTPLFEEILLLKSKVSYMAQIWNAETHKYEPYVLPEGASCYEEDMDKVVSCACCGKKLKYGDTFTSRRIHTFLGFGYGVCEDCYRKEFENE